MKFPLLCVRFRPTSQVFLPKPRHAHWWRKGQKAHLDSFSFPLTFYTKLLRGSISPTYTKVVDVDLPSVMRIVTTAAARRSDFFAARAIDRVKRRRQYGGFDVQFWRLFHCSADHINTVHKVEKNEVVSLQGLLRSPCWSRPSLRWLRVLRRALSQPRSSSGRADQSTRYASGHDVEVLWALNVDPLQLLTDRFALEGGGTTPCVTDDRKYCGGSYQGIIGKLDYIQGLGFDAVWISPIVANVEGFTYYGEAYHGYWAQDINKLNPHFGSPKDLDALSKALHARKMYLMVDIVVNHFGPANSSASFASFNPFNQPSYFHPKCLITDYNNQTDVEQCWLGDGNLALADVNTEDEWVVETYYCWIQSLVKEYAIDGIRIDTVKHVRKDFWPEFAERSGVYTVGEVYDGDTAYVKDYTGECLITPPPPLI
jgi:hypothetical protein